MKEKKRKKRESSKTAAQRPLQLYCKQSLPSIHAILIGKHVPYCSCDSGAFWWAVGALLTQSWQQKAFHTASAGYIHVSIRHCPLMRIEKIFICLDIWQQWRLFVKAADSIFWQALLQAVGVISGEWTLCQKFTVVLNPMLLFKHWKRHINVIDLTFYCHHSSNLVNKLTILVQMNWGFSLISAQMIYFTIEIKE